MMLTVSGWLPLMDETVPRELARNKQIKLLWALASTQTVMQPKVQNPRRFAGEMRLCAQVARNRGTVIGRLGILLAASRLSMPLFEHGRFTGDGWAAGHMAKGALLNNEVGVKWAFQPKGDAGIQWRTCKTATTLSVLISGKFKMVFRENENAPEKTIIFSEPGSYAIFGPGIQHWSEALEDSWFLTIRWPSLEQDCKVI